MRVSTTVLLLTLMVMAAGAHADGPLDRTRALPGIHKDMIGQDHCLKCHDATQRASDAKCLDCHKEIQASIDRGAGYHFRAVVTDEGLCESCHKEHQEELDKLTVWHNDEEMKAFDHLATGYGLEQAHAELECRKCHEPAKMADGVSQRKDPAQSFFALGTDCVSCHEDLHQAKLGVDCESCHLVTKWPELLENAPFDHAKADYPLEGKHADAKCEDCHKTERRVDPQPFEACTDCHADDHVGQLAHRADGGKCEACHAVDGFLPPRYDLAEHGESRFPLNGLHPAVACNACHGKERIEDKDTALLRYDVLDCRRCHEDPRKGHSSQVADRYGCVDCHVDVGWREMVYDHDRAEYKLTGAHKLVACGDCHETEGEDTDAELVRYLELGADCHSCHGDPHAAQFEQNSCENCHTTEDWRPTLFDHQKQSTYALEGKHLDADCDACHHMEKDDAGASFRRLKPLGVACIDCHAASGSVLREFTGLGAISTGGQGE